MRLTCTYLAIALFFFTPSFSQYAMKVSISDYVTIKVSAEEQVHNLQDLMNAVASSEYDRNGIEQVIKNSYSGAYNKIFDSSNVIIEDDINPASAKGKTDDKNVIKYLKDLDLMYTKSDNQSIVLTVSRVSGLKRSERFYLKVYYTSFFRNRNRTIDTSYTITNRVAEIFVRKDNNHWSTYIAHIGFFVPADTVNDVEYDVPLEMDSHTADLESAAINDQKNYQQQLQEKERKEQIEKLRTTNEAYDKLIDEGDKAMAIDDFKQALKKYSDASLLKPYDKLAFAKIANLQLKREQSKISREQVFIDFITTAHNAVKRREYKKAIEAFEAARGIDPIRIGEYSHEINDLKAKYSNVAKLEEMYKIGQYKEATSEYSSLIKKNKAYSDYYLGRGKCYDKQNEYSKAMKDFKEAYNLDNSNLQALLERADLNKRLGKFVDAITDYNSYLLSDKENPNVYLQLADLRMLNNNQLDDAIAIMNDGLNVPDLQKEPELYFKRGELLMKKSDWKNAIIDFSSVIRLDSTHKLALYDRGTCYLKTSRVNAAATDFESARRNGLDSIFINVIAGYAAERFDKATARFNKQATDSAIEQINDAIAIDPSNDKYRFTKGEYYFSLKQYQPAIQYYDEAVERNRNYANAWYKRGLSYQLLENYKTAIESFGKALTINPQYALSQKGIGDAQFALKDFGSAAVAYESCLVTISSSKINDNSFTAEVYNGLGKSYYRLNNYEKSLAALKNAIKKNEVLAEAYFNRGLSFYRSGQLNDAIADFDKALSLNNTPTDWKYYRARAYQDASKFDIAITQYNEVISADSTHLFPDAIYQRGKSYYFSKQYQSALPDYLASHTQQLDTVYASFNYETGNIYLNNNKYDSAIIWFNKAYAKDTANGFASYGIASALLLKGNKDEAYTWFERSFVTHHVPEKDIKRDPLIRIIVNDKKFRDLLKKYY